jgi:uncharacterized protein YyaL (SSP411 family)
MDAVVRLTGGGGWPLNVFCAPDGRPFYGGTYFPPAPAYGRPGWREVVEAIAKAWAEQREEVESQAGRILEALRARPTGGGERPEGREALRAVARRLMERADPAYGGFGPAPKFPTPTNLEAILLAQSLGCAPVGAFEHALFTLDRMARGGIYDQLGGGFHRYSTDARWLVPHFEKMLYDQGQLLRVYAEAQRQSPSGDPDLEWPVVETIELLEREMRGPEGGFFASLDADSEGEEGRFYVWTPAEIDAALGSEAGSEFAIAYGVEAAGNFEGGGRSVLSHALAGERPRFASARRRLLEARSGRVRPDTDRKHVTSWIAYTIGGLATAGSAFDRPDWVASAARGADFLLDRMFDADGRLLRIWNRERASVPAFLDDHAATLCALLDLHRAGGGERYVERALEVADAIRTRFFDAEARDLFFVPSDGEALVVRPSSDSDGATPAASGLAALGLVRISELAGRDELRAVVDAVLEAYAPILAREPVHLPTLARAAALRDAGLGVGLVLGDPDAPSTRLLARRARALLSSEEPVVVLPPGSAPAWLAREWLEGREMQAGAATAYICRGGACSLPATDPESLLAPTSSGTP